MTRLATICAGIVAVTGCLNADVTTAPETFPRFDVPGHNETLETVRALYWRHYAGSGPKATLWDQWLATPSLWPAEPAAQSDQFRKQWSSALLGRRITEDGYVATHQHDSIAHPDGWPFPMWTAAQGGHGWHFSYAETIGPPWRSDHVATHKNWELKNCTDAGVGEFGWNLQLTAPGATITSPEQSIETYQGPYVQLRWRAEGLGKAKPYLAWASKENPEFSEARRVYFEPIESGSTVRSLIKMADHPEWKGTINRLQLGFDNQDSTGTVMVQALFTLYDTRHNVNSQAFIRGSADYFWWTRDVDFLRKNMPRMRVALKHILEDHHVRQENVVLTKWPGHDGRHGFSVDANGNKTLHYGRGIGNNYWDLLPFGWKDTYATLLLYDALKVMAELERDAQHLKLPSQDAFSPVDLRQLAEKLKSKGNDIFWNSETGRFVACIDEDGNSHDYGLTFLNAEAVYYGFASDEHAAAIMAWLDGKRVVKDDTSQTTDIYTWRFAPRATTKRNIDWYGWVWNAPETIPFGGQVQDGGAVLGFSFHDLMARLKVLGPDNAWKRLKEIADWYREVQDAGGYRKYYDGTRPGTMQGNNTAGGLGLDAEFFESVLVPQVMISGFLGFEPETDGFAVNPQLPSDWPELTIDKIRYQDTQLKIRVTSTSVEITPEKPTTRECRILVRGFGWSVESPESIGIDSVLKGMSSEPHQRIAEVKWSGTQTIRFTRLPREDLKVAISANSAADK